jgi:hypothetical protein
VAQSSHNTETENPEGAEACPGEILTTAPEGEQTVEEIILTQPTNTASSASDGQFSEGSGTPRSRKRPEPIFIERSIDEVHVDSRYGRSLWEAGFVKRLLPRMSLLSEEGVRILCKAFPIRVSVIDGKYYTFGGMLSYDLARHCLGGSRRISVLRYEEVSEGEVLDAALFDQIILSLLMLTNDQADSWLIDELLMVLRLRPEIFAHPGKAKLIADFGRSSRNFRSKKSAKKPIRGEEDAA